MNHETQKILERFILGEKLSSSELNELKKLFTTSANRKEISYWLENNWELASFDDIEISYDKLKLKIQQSLLQRSKVFQLALGYSKYYQRIAAILFIPLIIGLGFYFLNSIIADENFYVAEAPLGQKAKIELPDGSTVWLNSGSNIRYSSNFNQKNRNIELEGEAFFDVKRNTGKPFIVNTSSLDVKVTGTRFNVNAYADEPIVETSLIEGKVDVFLNNGGKRYMLTPGKALTYLKSSKKIYSHQLNEEATISWKENRLVFINDDFSKLARKIEKWYNVKVIYDGNDFKENKLTVKLFEGEQLNHLLEIIETTVGAKCTIEGNKIQIIKL